MSVKEQWFEKRIGGDYRALAAEYSLSPVTARLLANRGIKGIDAVTEYFSEDLKGVNAYEDLPDQEKAVSLIIKKISEKKKMRVIGDYDIDGVCAAYILTSAIRKAGGDVDHRIPHRVNDGYGLNDRLVREAFDDGTDTIITCDNGISAISQAKLAKELGMDMIITDHHEIPFHTEDEKVVYDIPEADAVVDPKLPGSRYGYTDICGAVVAYKLMLALFDRMGIDSGSLEDLIEIAAFATIGDVMPLTGENRRLVSVGLKRLSETSNPGLKALISEQGIEGKKISVYHVGFVLGPCINATGRLDSAEKALQLLFETDEEKAKEYAHTLVVMNAERKEMTETACREAVRTAELSEYQKDRVLVIYMPDVHESIAGIVAGKVREKTGKPCFVLTKSGDFVKGSGRSIEEYDMYRAMNEAGGLLTKFGGHRMAGGLSMPEDNVLPFRKRVNENCTLTEDDIIQKIRFDMVLPFAYAGTDLVSEIEKLEPFGTGNPGPLFAAANVKVSSVRIVGRKKNVLTARVTDEAGTVKDAVFFGDVEEFKDYCEGHEKISILYNIKTDEYKGTEKAVITISHYR
ncbi:MAG: single-stranded-DNA-specific exonuclease RecJ [Lachnospiraceae bacterium]|nr:single-stranded-DNA-specific exonuclease RecJ [Lachnospiraceae bacterium]